MVSGRPSDRTVTPHDRPGDTSVAARSRHLIEKLLQRVGGQQQFLQLSNPGHPDAIGHRGLRAVP
jgi:hypothetical protein